MVEQITLAHPSKVGVGGFNIHGLDRLHQDIATVGANWFYTWTPDLTATGNTTAPLLQGWMTGSDLDLIDRDGNGAVVLGDSGDAWMLQDVQAEAGRTYTLGVDTAGSSDARGGAMLYFKDSSGATIGSAWLPLSGGSGTASLPGATAPAGTTSAQVLLWGEAGALELDTVSLTEGTTERLTNAGLDAGAGVAPSAAGAEYVHMIWGAADVAPETMEYLTGVATILGFNEPDLSAQSDMTVEEALALWPELMKTGARLGSPAPTQGEVLGEQSWLGRFMAGAEAAGHRVDFIAVHYYSGDGDVAAFETFLQDVHAQYGKPVWVTEWSLADWWDTDRFTHADNAAFLREATVMMDRLDFVERHAWFGLYDGMDGWNISTNLVEADGTLTEVGQTFLDAAETEVTLASAALEGGGETAETTGEETSGDDTPPEETSGTETVDAGSTEAGTPTTETEPETTAGSGETETTNEEPSEEQTASDGSTVDEPEPGDSLVAEDDGASEPTEAAPTGAAPEDDTSAPPPPPTVIAQFGQVEVDHRAVTIELDHAFINPVVIATVTTVNGGQPMSARVMDVESDRFSIYLDEPRHLDGWHLIESASWMVVEAGSWISESGFAFQAGTVETGVLSSRGTTAVDFHHAFSDRPAIFTTDQTSNDRDMIWTRAQDPDAEGFRLVMEEEEKRNSGKHGTEEIGWLAVERGAGIAETAAGSIAFETSDSDFTLDSIGGTIDFDTDFVSPPVFLAGISGRADTDPTGLRIDGLTGEGAYGFLQEDTSRDAETWHAPENVDWFALDGPGTLFGHAADALMWGA